MTGRIYCRRVSRLPRTIRGSVWITSVLSGDGYFAWAPHLDIISIDTYPANTPPAWETALTHDLMRSLKGGRPHLVMEQSPSQVNWMPLNPHKRPGRMRLQSHQAIAHGADGVM